MSKFSNFKHAVKNRLRSLRNRPHDKNLYIMTHVPKCAGATIAYHIEHRYAEEQRLDFFQHRENIASLLNESERAFLKKEWGLNLYYLRRDWVKQYIETFSERQRKAIHCVYGHLAYYGVHELFAKPYRYITFVRNPVDRFISFYNHRLAQQSNTEKMRHYEMLDENGKILTLEQWLESADLNRYSMTSFLAQLAHAESFLKAQYLPSQEDLKNVKEMLRNFYFVGLTENDEDRDFVYQRLEITTFLSNKNVRRDKSTYIRPKNPEQIRQLITLKCPMDMELYTYAGQLNQKMKAEILDFKRAARYTYSLREKSQQK